MARQARTNSSTNVYHVMIRGNNKLAIFQSSSYRKMISNIFQKEAYEKNVDIYAWCIMNNHLHLVLLVDFEVLPKYMSKITSTFAQRYNYFEDRIGHVFQGRYRSQPVESDTYLMQVIRYVHNNPVKANITTNASEYKWSSYNLYLSPSVTREKAYILSSYFHNDINIFRHYHTMDDTEDHLDISEDMLTNRINITQVIIQDYCDRLKIQSILDVKNNVTRREEIIVKLIKKSNLSNRKIASITGFSCSMIRDIKIKSNTT